MRRRGYGLLAAGALLLSAGTLILTAAGTDRAVLAGSALALLGVLCLAAGA